MTDFDVKPIYNKQKPRKVYLSSKVNWEEIYKACEGLSNEIIGMAHENLKVEGIWETFKSGIQTLLTVVDNVIPSKTLKKKSSVQWFNRKLKNDKEKMPPIRTCKKVKTME